MMILTKQKKGSFLPGKVAFHSGGGGCCVCACARAECVCEWGGGVHIQDKPGSDAAL